MSKRITIEMATSYTAGILLAWIMENLTGSASLPILAGFATVALVFNVMRRLTKARWPVHE